MNENCVSLPFCDHFTSVIGGIDCHVFCDKNVAVNIFDDGDVAVSFSGNGVITCVDCVVITDDGVTSPSTTGTGAGVGTTTGVVPQRELVSNTHMNF